MNRYAEVIVPLGLNATFTYAVPEEMAGEIVIGSRVIVPFGLKKFYTAIVVGFPLKPPAEIELKEISLLLDSHPIVRHPQLKLWRWIADYYLCDIGDVYRAAVPSALKIESETSVSLDPDFDITEIPELSRTEIAVIQQLDHEKTMSLTALEKALDRKNLTPVISRMIDNGIVIVTEKLVERYHSKTVRFVELAMDVHDAFTAVKGAPKREAMLLALIEMSGANRPANQRRDVTAEQLIERTASTQAILKALEKNGVVRIVKREINRFNFNGIPTRTLPHLSESQAKALDEIHNSWLNHDVTLLHGITSSGKTEIYIHLIDYVLRRGQRAFYLVPEIALTTQLTRRLQDVFGDKVLIYHSKFSDSERADVWKKLLDSTEPCVIIGARSAVFLPFGNLNLIIVDEEHESSYKQADPAPRYNARDTAIVLAALHGAKTLLGSATPSIETRFKAESGKFGLVELFTRFGGATLPKTEVVDIIKARNNGNYRSPFALSTISHANMALSKGEQVIFFQNRRGFAPIARCTACAWTPKCEFCDVSMTYHKTTRQLVCHYCGATRTLPTVCPQCGEPKIEIYGYGTERVEDSVASCFEGKKIMRMDLDTTRNKDGYERIISDFSARKADILIGTQMVTKGLDFDGVSVVGILNADNLINIPDFRSAERAFNMLQQVAGRAGRRNGSEGHVIIQTTQPDHPVIRFASTGDYAGFYSHELEERRQWFYPPFSRIINIYLKHRDVKTVSSAANLYAGHLRNLLGQRVFGPEEPQIARIQSFYIRKIMLKIETDASITKVKKLLRDLRNSLSGSDKTVKQTIIYYDVDPM